MAIRWQSAHIKRADRITEETRTCEISLKVKEVAEGMGFEPTIRG